MRIPGLFAGAYPAAPSVGSAPAPIGPVPNPKTQQHDTFYHQMMPQAHAVSMVNTKQSDAKMPPTLFSHWMAEKFSAAMNWIYDVDSTQDKAETAYKAPVFHVKSMIA